MLTFILPEGEAHSKAAGPLGHRAPLSKAVQQTRLAARRQLFALDKQLRLTTGEGLVAFRASVASCRSPYEPHKGKVLTLQLDEGSLGYSLVWWLLLWARLRMVFLRGPLHREWHDVQLAIKGQGHGGSSWSPLWHLACHMAHSTTTLQFETHVAPGRLRTAK